MQDLVYLNICMNGTSKMGVGHIERTVHNCIKA